MTPEEFIKRILNNKKIPKGTTVKGGLDFRGGTSLTAESTGTD